MIHGMCWGIWACARSCADYAKYLMKKFLLIGLWIILPLAAQELKWSINAAEILPGALSAETSVQINPASSGYVILQNDAAAKLVRVGKDGTVRVYELPFNTDAYYTVRMNNENKVVVQAGRLVTVLTYRKYTDPETQKKVTGWQQQNITLPTDADEEGLSVAYDRAAQTIGDHVWYLTQNESGIVQQVILRKVP